MDQEFQDDDDQEQQSQQAESGSNLNDASTNQEDETNVNNQLEISKDKKQMKRICLIPIQKEWKSERQIFQAFCMLQIVILCVFCGIILGHMYIATYLIDQSALQETQASIQNTLSNQIQTAQNLYIGIFNRNFVSLSSITKIFLTSLQLDDSFYDESFSAFPLTGPNKYISINQAVPTQSQYDQYLSQQYYQKKQISLDYISYFSLSNPKDWTALSPLAQNYLKGADILNYYLKNLVYFQGSQIRIQQLYLSFGNDLQVFYPAGACANLSQKNGQTIDITQRKWYLASQNAFKTSNSATYQVTGPYQDLVTNIPVVTVSMPIVAKDGNMIGVIGIDIFCYELDSVLPPQSELYQSSKFYLANISDGSILNDPAKILAKDPFNSGQSFYFVQNSQYTNITNSNWQYISNQNYSVSQYFEFMDANNNQQIVYRQFVSNKNFSPNQLVFFIIITDSDGFGEYYSIQSNLQSSFQKKQYYLIITECSVVVFCILLSVYFVKSIVAPLQELADCTKEFTNQEKKNSNSSEIKKKKQFEDIKSTDKVIDSLIQSFKKLIKDLSGFKKGTRRENHQQSEDIIEYPRSDQSETGFYRFTRFLFNYEEFQERLNYYVDQLQKLLTIKKTKEEELQETEYYDSSQNESQYLNQENLFYKIEATFFNFIEVVLDRLLCLLNEQIHKGHLPYLGKEDIDMLRQIEIFCNLINICSKNLIIYDKFRSQQSSQNGGDYDDQDNDPVQEDDISNMPDENLIIYDRKSTIKRFDEVTFKFKRIEQLNIQLVKKKLEKKNIQFLNEILPKSIID
ncbi:hypothetical protein ABPG74_004479 [Tetrahymena malaccensis]